jgi:hypothetical protein
LQVAYQVWSQIIENHGHEAVFKPFLGLDYQVSFRA